MRHLRAAATWPRTVWRNRRRHPDDPRLLTYIVTFACNAKCIMCDSWKKTGKDDLSLSEIAEVFRQLPRMDAVRLSGGEPFVRKDLLNIAELSEVYLRPLVLHVTTNGFLSERIVDFCERRPKKNPLFLLVSIDGVEDKHNQVRGRPIAWKRATDTLRALAPRQKELRLTLAVNQTIVDAEGADHYKRLADWLRPLGIQHQMVMAYDASATYSTDDEIDVSPNEIGDFTTFGTFSSGQLRALLDAACDDARHLPRAERIAKQYYLRGIRARLLDEGAVPNPRCVALNSHMRLFPNGDVPTCQFNSKTVGNLRYQSFDEVWHGGDIAQQRHWVQRCAGCWAECEVLPNALYSGELVRLRRSK